MKKNTRATLFNVEILEPRILLSADPIVGELVQQYHNANNNNLGELHVTAPNVNENVLLKQQSQENAALNLDLAKVKNQNFALNSIEVKNFSDFKNTTGQIVIGNENSNAIIHLGDVKTDDSILAFNQNLLIRNPQFEGEIFIDDDLVGGKNADLTIDGSGHTTTLSANISTVNTNITINDSLKISGIRTISSGASIQLGSSSNHFLDGDSISGNDTLTMTAATTGNIIVKGVVGGTDALEGLTITGTTASTKVNNVTFESDVTVNGDVIIDASGTVTFNAALNITNGHLTINGASLIVFGNNVVVANGKNIFLEGDEITFNGGQESVRGTGTLTMRPTTLTNDIAIASPPAENTLNTLNLSSNELITLADGFSKIIIGRENTATNHADASATGTVYVGSKAANQNTFTDALEIFAKNIELKDYSNSDFKFQTKDTIKLDVLENIVIYNEVKAIDGVTNKNITLYSASGEIKQISNDTDALITESLGTGDLTISSVKGIDLGWVNAVNIAATNSTSGNIKINSNAPIAVTTTFTTMTGVPTGNIALSSDTNNLIFNVPLTTTSGLITLNSGSTLVINNPITTTSGTIDIKSKNDLTLNAITSSSGSSPISFTSTAGNIFQNVDITSATPGGLITLKAGINIEMLNGKKISTGSSVSGTIMLTAGADIKVSILEATTAISVISTGGAIIDNLTGETATDLNLKGTTTSVTLKATKGIGTSVEDIDTLISTLTMANDAATGVTGGIFITEIDALTISEGGIKSSGAEGSVIISNTGLLTINGSIDVTGAVGNILLQNTISDIALNGLIKSASGNISIVALAGAIFHSTAGDIEVSTDTTKTIELEAALSITMVDGTVIKTKGGNVRLNAKSGNIQLGSVDAVTGSVSILTTNNFSVFDIEGTDTDTDITADNLRITSKSIGSGTNSLDINATNLSAVTLDGLFLSEGNGVIVKEIPIVTVNRVGASAATTLLADATVQSDLISSTSGAIVLISLVGDITLDKSITSLGAQNVLLNAQGALKINALITVGSGSLHLISGSTFTQTADGDIAVTGGTIDIVATTAIVMANGAVTQTVNRDIRYKTSAGDITLGFINAGLGSVAILAGGNIIDAEAITVVPAADIVAKAVNLTAQNGVATGENPLEITVDNLTATSGSAGMFVLEIDAVSVEQVSVSVNLISAAGISTLDAPITAADLTASANGSIVLRATDITLKDSNNNTKAVAAIGSGNILLNASAGDILIDSSVSSTTGNISLVASKNLVISSPTQIFTGGIATVDLMATGGITMANGTKIQTETGNIRLNATSNDITLGQLNAGTGNVSLVTTGGRILDGNDASLDIIANGLRLNTQNGVGTNDNALDINVTTLSAIMAGGLFLNESDGITVTNIDAISVNRVDAKATVSAVIDVAQSDLISSANDGAIVLSTLAGDITILDGNEDNKGIFRNAVGNILLDAAGNIVIQTDINANGGNITLLSLNNIIQGETGSLNTIQTGSIDVNAGISINQTAGAKIQTAGGNIRLNAAENLTLNSVNATTGSVSLNAKNIVDVVSDNPLSVVAVNLRINAMGVGTGINPLDINVDNLSAKVSTSGLFVTEVDSVILTETPMITVNRVAKNGTISDLSEIKQSDIFSTTGAIVMTTKTGDITVLDGNADGIGISVLSGNILLNAAANLSIQSTIENFSGNINLISGATLSQTEKGNLTALNLGTIDVKATTAIVMADGAITKTANKDIRYTSIDGDITVSALNAVKANIALLAGGSVIDATTAIDIVAIGLNVFANVGIGSVTNPLAITATKLAANSSEGGMFITDLNAVNTDQVDVMVSTVDLNGVATAETVTANDLKTTTGAISLTAPKILIKDSNNDNNGVVSTSGHILLNATEGNLELQSNVSSESGNISLLSKSAITANDLKTTTGAISLTAPKILIKDSNNGVISTSGNILLNATEGNLELQTSVSSESGNISLLSKSAITANDLKTTTGAISLTAPKILIKDSNNDNNGVISTSGHILLNATEGNLELQTSVSSESGNISLLSKLAIKQKAKGQIITGENGGIDLDSGSDITPEKGAKIQAAAGNIRLKAIGNILLNTVMTTGNVSLIADKILDGNNTATSITANGLRINANSFGSNINAINTDINNLSAKVSTGGLFITEAKDLTITEIPVMIMPRVGLPSITDATQSDLISGGTVVIILASGDLSLLDGGNKDKKSLVLTGKGNLLLESKTGNLNLQAAVSNNAGNISLRGASITQGALGNLNVVAKNTIELNVDTALTMTEGAKIQTTGGNIRLNVTAGTMALSELNAGTGNVSLIAKSIINSNSIVGKINNVTAVNLRLNSNGVGLPTKAIDTNVEKLSAIVYEGGIFVNEANNITVTETPLITVSRVNAKGTVGKIIDAKQSNLISGKNGAIVLSAGGDISLTKGRGAFDGSVKNEGAGNTLIESRGGLIDIKAAISNGSGALSLIAEKEIKLNLAGKISGQGTIDVSTNKNVLMSDAATITAQNNTIRLFAKETLQIRGVNAGTGSVSLLANRILDAGDLKDDITAANLRINAVNSVAERLNFLDINVNKLSAVSGKDGFFVRESDKLAIETTAEMTVNRVKISGETINITDAAQNGLSSDKGTISVIAENDVTINKKITSVQGDIFIQSMKGSILQNAAVESTGKIQLQTTKSVVKSTEQLAKIINSLDSVSIQPKNESFYFWTETVKLVG